MSKVQSFEGRFFSGLYNLFVWSVTHLSLSLLLLRLLLGLVIYHLHQPPVSQFPEDVDRPFEVGGGSFRLHLGRVVLTALRHGTSVGTASTCAGSTPSATASSTPTTSRRHHVPGEQEPRTLIPDKSRFGSVHFLLSLAHLEHGVRTSPMALIGVVYRLPRSED